MKRTKHFLAASLLSIAYCLLPIASFACMPVADFSASTDCVPAGGTVNFSDLSVNTPTSWSWQFPGGTPNSSTIQNPSVTYSAAGVYDVTLTATNGSGSDAETKQQYIIAGGTLPSVNLGPDTAITCGTNIILNAGVAGATYLWSTGSAAQTITVSYSAPGTYWVQVTKCSSILSDTIVITSGPPAVNLGNDISMCGGSTITLNAGNTGAPAATYLWSTGAITQTIVAGPGTYWVQVTRCALTTTDTITITNNAMSSCNNQWAWSSVFTSSYPGYEDGGFDVVADAAHNSYVVGRGASPSAVVAKFDSNGNMLWSKSFPGSTNTGGMAIALEPGTNNVYIGGLYTTSITIGSITLVAPPGNCSPMCVSHTAFLAKLDNATGNTIWANRYCNSSSSNPTDSQISGIGVDGTGNIYIAGTFGTSYFIGSQEITIGSTTLTAAGGNEIFIAKINSSGTALWAKKAGGTCGMNDEDCNEYVGGGINANGGVYADAAGNTYITGSLSSFDGGATFNFGTCSLTLPTSTTSDIYVVKYDPNGNCLWAQQGSMGGGGGRDITVDGLGNVYTTGNVSGTQGTLSKYSPDGILQWMRQPTGMNFTQLHADSIGNSYSTGRIVGTSAQFGSITAFTSGVDRAFVAKYDTYGNAVNVALSGGASGNDAGEGIYFKCSIWVTGNYNAGISFGALTPLSADDGFVAKLEDIGSSGCIPGCITTYSNSNTSICSGDSILIVGNWQNTAGTYYDTLTSVNGCDSVIVTTLTVNQSPINNLQFSICTGDSIFAGGSWQTTAGTYYNTLTSVNGCDSVIVTTLTVNQSSITNLQFSICTGDSIFAGGSWQTTAGIYYDTLTTTGGCDSIIATTLSVNTASSSTNNLSVCNGGSIFLAGTWQTAAGTYYDTLTTTGGCDSVIITNLTIKPLPEVDAGIDISISLGQSVKLTATTSAASFQWSPALGLSCTDCLTPLANPESTTIYRLLVTDTNGCTSTDSVTVINVIECGEVFIPTAYSPNQDGFNELECVMGNCVAGNPIKSFCFSIYDRWGEKVFETTDAKTCWDGTYKGKAMDVAVFVYSLEITLTNGNQELKRGNISLIR